MSTLDTTEFRSLLEEERGRSHAGDPGTKRFVDSADKTAWDEERPALDIEGTAGNPQEHCREHEPGRRGSDGCVYGAADEKRRQSEIRERQRRRTG